jgi:hypothetical protein
MPTASGGRSSGGATTRSVRSVLVKAVTLSNTQGECQSTKRPICDFFPKVALPIQNRCPANDYDPTHRAHLAIESGCPPAARPRRRPARAPRDIAQPNCDRPQIPSISTSRSLQTCCNAPSERSAGEWVCQRVAFVCCVD